MRWSGFLWPETRHIDEWTGCQATFYKAPNGVTYNAYLTQTDAVEEEANHTKFYSLKLVRQLPPAARVHFM